MARNEKRHLYTVYNNRTDELVISDATAEECANAMNLTYDSFWNILTRTRQGKIKKWHITTHEIKEAPMRCKIRDCFNCPYPDCINDYVRPPYQMSDEQKEHCREYERAYRQKRKESGLCVKCGKKPAVVGKLYCNECIVKYKKSNERYRRKKGQLPKEQIDGIFLCQRCGKEKPIEDHKLCKACYEWARAAMLNARSQRKVKNSFERGNDDYWKLKKAEKVQYENKSSKRN